MIVKIQRQETPFVMVSKTVFEDHRISWAARGLMGYLLSKPDGWRLSVADILKHSPKSEDGTAKRGNGEEAVYSILRELRGFGYAHYEQGRSERGVMTQGEWTVYEQPLQAAEPHRAKPDAVQPRPANPDYNNNEGSNNDSTNSISALTDGDGEGNNTSNPNQKKKAAPPKSTPGPARTLKNAHGIVHLPPAYTTRAAEAFEGAMAAVCTEVGVEWNTYNWAASNGADMAALKKIVEMVALLMTERRAKALAEQNTTGEVVITAEGIIEGVRYFFDQGARYFIGIASRTDGTPRGLCPTAMRRQFNNIITATRSKTAVSAKPSTAAQKNMENGKSVLSIQQAISDRLAGGM